MLFFFIQIKSTYFFIQIKSASKKLLFNDNTDINPVSICTIVIETCLMLNILFLDCYANNNLQKAEIVHNNFLIFDSVVK